MRLAITHIPCARGRQRGTPLPQAVMYVTPPPAVPPSPAALQYQLPVRLLHAPAAGAAHAPLLQDGAALARQVLGGAPGGGGGGHASALGGCMEGQVAPGQQKDKRVRLPLAAPDAPRPLSQHAERLVHQGPVRGGHRQLVHRLISRRVGVLLLWGRELAKSASICRHQRAAERGVRPRTRAAACRRRRVANGGCGACLAGAKGGADGLQEGHELVVGIVLGWGGGRGGETTTFVRVPSYVPRQAGVAASHPVRRPAAGPQSTRATSVP